MKFRFPPNRRVLLAYYLKYMDHCTLFGSLAIQTSSVEGALLLRTVMFAYTLDGGILTEIGCDFPDTSEFRRILLTDQELGKEVFTMVVELYDQSGIDYGTIDSFNICAYDLVA